LSFGRKQHHLTHALRLLIKVKDQMESFNIEFKIIPKI